MNVLHSVKDYVTNVFQHDSGAGAIDVVAVQQPDGSLLCSPFCVHFGPLHNHVKQDERRHVTVEVNGQVVDSVQMKVLWDMCDELETKFGGGVGLEL